MERLKTNFKNMKAIDLLKHYDERKLELDKVQNEVIELKKQMDLLKKKELLVAKRFITVKHWVESRKMQHFKKYE